MIYHRNGIGLGDDEREVARAKKRSRAENRIVLPKTLGMGHRWRTELWYESGKSSSCKLLHSKTQNGAG